MGMDAESDSSEDGNGNNEAAQEADQNQMDDDSALDTDIPGNPDDLDLDSMDDEEKEAYRQKYRDYRAMGHRAYMERSRRRKRQGRQEQRRPREDDREDEDVEAELEREEAQDAEDHAHCESREPR